MVRIGRWIHGYCESPRRLVAVGSGVSRGLAPGVPGRAIVGFGKRRNRHRSGARRAEPLGVQGGFGGTTSVKHKKPFPRITHECVLEFGQRSPLSVLVGSFRVAGGQASSPACGSRYEDQGQEELQPFAHDVSDG